MKLADFCTCAPFCPLPSILLHCVMCAFPGKALFPGSSTMNQIDKILSSVPRPTKKDLESVNSPFAKSILDQLGARWVSLAIYVHRGGGSFLLRT